MHDVIQRALLAGISLLLVSSIEADEKEFFESRIRPVLVKHCYECHSSAASQVKGGLLLDSRQRLLNGGETGPAIIPGKPDESLLIEALRFESFEMPPAGRLPETVIKDFEQWIEAGAFDPRETPPDPAAVRSQTWKAQLEERRTWWNLQPPRQVQVPDIQDVEWSRSPVDRFVYEALREQELSPAAPADALTLLRRVSFVLTGLPPTLERVRTFPTAYAEAPELALENLIDELLASPHFGERFARHWMDVVRYTDTYGYEWDNPARGSWEYRDYLIRAFNDDVGFDQLIREQLAGDLLESPRLNEQQGINESLIGPMFYHMGEHRHGASLDFNGIHQEMINNKIDAFSKAFLGMTVACARCHDHELDAISQSDYYALAGVFMSSRWTARCIDLPARHAQEIESLQRLRGTIRQQLATAWSSTDHNWAEKLPAWTEQHAGLREKTSRELAAFPLLQIAGATDDTIAEVWQNLATDWQRTRTERQQNNSARFQTLAGFDKPGFPSGWAWEGDGIRHGHVSAGDPLVSLNGDSLISSLLEQGYHTHALSSKLPGAVRLPAQDELPGSFVSLRLQGSEWSGYLVVPQNAFQTEAVTFLTPDSQGPAGWRTIGDLPLKNGVTRVLPEIVTADMNPNFPPRTGLARAGSVTLADSDLGYDKRSWFSLTRIVTHDSPGTPLDELEMFTDLYLAYPEAPDASPSPGSSATDGSRLDDPPETVAAAWTRVANWFEGSIERWCAGRATDGDVARLNWLLAAGLLPNSHSDLPEVTSLVQEYRRIESGIAFPRTVNSMDERSVAPINYRLNVRGDVDVEGPPVPRSFLEVHAGQHQVSSSPHSGRLELARYLSSPDNPHTSRVYVNRVWYWVFGQGIVSTPNDFGRLGERPSHPELLDWLSRTFADEGWSTKRLLKRLLLSRTFRQSGSAGPRALDVDPGNRLLHHYPTRRLEAESVRDSLLAVSGRLDPALYGRPIDPPRSVEDPKKRLFSGPLDSHGRRSIYLEMSIMDPPRFLVCFNLPDLKLPTGRRDVTNVPAQALALLNDPFVEQLAEHWATRLIDGQESTVAARVVRMFQEGLGRSPSEVELQRWTTAVEQFAKLAPETQPLMMNQAAWSELAHSLFNTKEFLYCR